MAISTGTATNTRMRMADTDLLTLTQWLSPAFPLGAFAWSHGLETAVSEGRVEDAGGLQDWLGGVLELGAGWSDAVLLSLALRGQEAAALGALAEALAPSAERWAETRAQGAAFARTVTGMTGERVPDLALPVAVGVAARSLALAPRQVIALYLHGFASNLVSAGVRFIPLGQTEGQRVLAALHPLIARIAARAGTAGEDDLAAAAFLADIDAARHETLEVRIFRS